MSPEKPRGFNPDEKKPFWTKNKFVAAVAAATLGAFAGSESKHASAGSTDVYPQTTHEEKFEPSADVEADPGVEQALEFYRAAATEKLSDEEAKKKSTT